MLTCQLGKKKKNHSKLTSHASHAREIELGKKSKDLVELEILFRGQRQTKYINKF